LERVSLLTIEKLATSAAVKSRCNEDRSVNEPTDEAEYGKALEEEATVADVVCAALRSGRDLVDT
jgi:hypothetical protein